MITTSVSELRKNMARHLEQVKLTKKPLVFWNRNKREYLVIPYPNTNEDETLFDISENLEDKLIMSEYYAWIENIMSDWSNDEHNDLFE